jgi:hypothetical protein
MQKLARTLYYRIRPLPNICSPHPGPRAYAERQAVNSVIQGTASDIAKRAMISIHQQLRALHVSSGREPQSIARLTLQLHDEIVVETEMGWLQQVACIMRRCMETVFCPPQAALPFPVSIKVGPTLGTLQPWEPEQQETMLPKQESEAAVAQRLLAGSDLAQGMHCDAAAAGRRMEEEERLWDASHWDHAAAGLTPSSQGLQLSDASTCISSYASASPCTAPYTAQAHPYAPQQQHQHQR